MTASYRTITGVDVSELARQMSSRGYGVLDHYLSDADLEPLRTFANNGGQGTQGTFFDRDGVQSLAETAFMELPASPGFRAACQQLYELGSGRAAPKKVAFHQVFRCLRGPLSRVHSYRFHYDSYVVTVLMPIVIPLTGSRGDLLMFPNARPIRRFYLTNLIDKFMVDNPISQKFFRWVAKKRKLGSIAVNMNPGSLYFFWGCRTIHANEPCDPDVIRATALLHFGDPYGDNQTRAFFRKLRKVSVA